MIENNDFVNNCDNILSEFPETDFLINTPISAESLERLNLPSFRISQDKSRLNNLGHSLLDFCKTMSFIIYNGRLGEDRDYGNVTNVKENTIVDYCISDVDLIPYVCNFKILNFDPLLYIGHTLPTSSKFQGKHTHECLI